MAADKASERIRARSGATAPQRPPLRAGNRLTPPRLPQTIHTPRDDARLALTLAQRARTIL